MALTKSNKIQMLRSAHIDHEQHSLFMSRDVTRNKNLDKTVVRLIDKKEDHPVSVTVTQELPSSPKLGIQHTDVRHYK